MNLPCDKKSLCLDPADPFQNLSSEAPDAAVFFGLTSGPGSIRRVPSGPGAPGPNPGGMFSAECLTTDGPFICVAPTQEEADLCVQRNSQLCDPQPGGPPPDGGAPGTDPTGGTVFRNTPQSCTDFCPDGLPFTFGVPAGIFVATSQILADREAHSYACRQARRNKVCLGTLTGKACVGSEFSQMIDSVGFELTYMLAGGELPPGLSISEAPGGVLISGTPTSAGDFTFTIKAISGSGSFMVKTFTLPVLEITNPSVLPTASSGLAYSVQLAGDSGTPPYTFAITAGALPPGLTMDINGLISGIPGSTGTFEFTAQLQDSDMATCQKNFSIQVNVVGFFICNWPTVESLLVTEPGCPASVLPDWGGLFNVVMQNAFPALEPNVTAWLFVNQSVKGMAMSPSESPLWPNGNWQSDCFAALYYTPSNGTWTLIFDCIGCNAVGLNWEGTLINNNPNNPSGVYTKANGDALIPTITIGATQPHWDTGLAWGTPTIFTQFGTTASFTPANAPGASFLATAHAFSFLDASATNDGTLTHSGHQQSVRITVQVSQSGGSPGSGVGVSILFNGVLNNNVSIDGGPFNNTGDITTNGTHTLDFVLPDRCSQPALTVTIRPAVHAHGNPHDVTMSGTVTNMP